MPVLALFDPAAQPALLDAADIAFDQSTFFRDPLVLPVASDAAAVLTMSTHFSSSQDYVTNALLLLAGDRLALVDTVFTFDDKNCGYERTQFAGFQTGGSNGAYADIEVSVNEKTTHTEEVCTGQDVPAEGTRTIGVTYRWDAANGRYAPDSEAFEKLAREDESRF